MTDTQMAIMTFLALRVAVLAVGALFVYLGYRLFLYRLPTDSTDIQANWGNRRLIVSRAAPGTIFALLGVAMIAIVLLRGQVTVQEESRVPVTSPHVPATVQQSLKKVIGGAVLDQSEREALASWLRAAEGPQSSEAVEKKSIGVSRD